MSLATPKELLRLGFGYNCMSTVRFRDPAGSIRIGKWTDDGIEFGGTIYAPDDVDVLSPSEPEKSSVSAVITQNTLARWDQTYPTARYSFSNRLTRWPLMEIQSPCPQARNKSTGKEKSA